MHFNNNASVTRFSREPPSLGCSGNPYWAVWGGDLRRWRTRARSIPKEMELEAAALEVASKHWHASADDLLRRERNKTRRLERERLKLQTRLERAESEARRLRRELVLYTSRVHEVRAGVACLLAVLNSPMAQTWRLCVQ